MKATKKLFALLLAVVLVCTTLPLAPQSADSRRLRGAASPSMKQKSRFDRAFGGVGSLI